MKFDISNILSLAFLATATAKAIPDDSTPITAVASSEKEDSKLLEIKEKCGEANLIDHEGQYVCLKPYEKDVPSNIEEILMQKIVFYQDEYHVIDPLYSSQCSESSDVLDCYINVAEVVGKNVTSIIPKLDDNAEDLSDNTKMSLSEYYCGKDNFYEVNGKYVCLTPYHGYFNVNVEEMFNKRIVHYNDEYYLVNYLFSNVCELSPDYMQCYNDLTEILDSDFNSLLPLYDFEVDTPEIRNPLAENEVDVEEILDKYRCGPENFYSLDHLHVCLDPVEKSDVPSEANIAMSVNINILYNEQYYTVNKDFSSMGVHIAGYPVFNYEKIARILGTTIKDIVPKKGDSIDEEIDSILTGDYCINQYNNKVLSKTVCLTPYDGPIPSTVEERQTQGIINYYNVYYQINRENSNVCGEDDSSKCYDELASILKEDKATLLGEVKP